MGLMNVIDKDFQYMLECMERDLATLLVEKRGMTIRQALSVLYDSETYRLLQKPNTGLFSSLRTMCIRICRRK